MRKQRLARSAAVVLLATVTVTMIAAAPASAAPIRPPSAPTVGTVRSGALPAPPKPPRTTPTAKPGLPKLSATLPNLVPKPAVTAPIVGTQGVAAAGASATQRTLVLYDTTGAWGWLGEAYAVQTANLVSHGSAYVMHPVAGYTAGEIAKYTDVIYVGSTYDEALPIAFLDDVLTGSRPVMWMNDNLWQLTQRAANFSTQYGFTWTGFDYTSTPTVTYKGVALNRDPLAAASGLLATVVTNPAKATVLAVANKSTGGTEPWAIRSGNLTYIGEIPFSYVGATDRYNAAADLIGAMANPARVNRKRALVRLEDVSPANDPVELKTTVDYLFSQRVPFSINVIPLYLDPKGVANNGTPESISLAQAPALVTVLKYALTHGGTMIMEGYTHQYSNVNNPYTGVTGDDFEFYLAHIDATGTVIYDSPPPVDSKTWVQGRISAGQALFSQAGLVAPKIFLPPHYAASAVDYGVFAKDFAARYDRGLYFAGWCPGGVCGTGTPNYTRIYGQYFPYLVRDIYGSLVVPEALGDVELLPYNNHPARLPADIVASAAGMSVVGDGVSSFFYDPSLGTTYLSQTVTGIRALGYQFVSASTVIAG
jgi:uncharacterized protein YdaL